MESYDERIKSDLGDQIDELREERDRLAERVRELEAERDRAWDRVVRERDRADKVPSAALCSCRRPASCLGAYEGCAVEFSCDVCCGHGNEDGWCVPVAEAPARIAALEAENAALRERVRRELLEAIAGQDFDDWRDGVAMKQALDRILPEEPAQTNPFPGSTYDPNGNFLEPDPEAKPKHWCGPHAICGGCGEPWPHPEGPYLVRED